MGFSFWISFCLLYLSSFALYFVCPAAIVLFGLFLIIRLKMSKWETKLSVAIIFAVLTVIWSPIYYFIGAQIAIFNYAHNPKAQVAQNNTPPKESKDILSISELKENYRYDEAGKISYIDVSLKIASKIPTKADLALKMATPEAFTDEADISVLIDQTPKEFTFPVKVNDKKAGYFDDRFFAINLDFKNLSKEFYAATQVSYIAFELNAIDGKECDLHREYSVPTCYSPILRTRKYKYSEFFTPPKTESTSSNAFLK
jgi:hypothetical protein